MLDSIQAEQGSSVYLSSISLEFLIPCPIASVYVYFDNLCVDVSRGTIVSRRAPRESSRQTCI